MAIDPFTGEVFEKKRNNQVYAPRANQIKHNNLKALEIRKKVR